MLKLCRYFDERMEALYRQGRLPGAIYSGRGQEGTHVGVAWALRARRLPVPHAPRPVGPAREGPRPQARHGAVLGSDRRLHARARRQQPHRRLAGQPDVHGHVAPADRLPGRRRRRPRLQAEGTSRTSRSRSAATAPRRTAAGTRRSTHRRCIRLPVVWVVNNNQFAYSTPNPLEFSTPTIAERAVAYGMPGRARRRRRRARGLRGRRARPSSARVAAAGRR